MFLQGVAKADYYPLQYPFWGVMQDVYGPMYPWNLDYYRPSDATPDQLATYPKAYINAGLAKANLNSRYPVMQTWEADLRTGVGTTYTYNAIFNECCLFKNEEYYLRLYFAGRYYKKSRL